jgi:hypothetical protein
MVCAYRELLQGSRCLAFGACGWVVVVLYVHRHWFWLVHLSGACNLLLMQRAILCIPFLCRSRGVLRLCCTGSSIGT